MVRAGQQVEHVAGELRTRSAYMQQGEHAFSVAEETGKQHMHHRITLLPSFALLYEKQLTNGVVPKLSYGLQ